MKKKQIPPDGNTPAKSITNFKQSVAKNKGYYIGRYEARTETARNEKNKNTLTPITEKGTDFIYTYVTQIQAAERCQTMYGSDKPFTSDLMNSYAWDTATLFLQTCGTNDKYSIKNSVNTGSPATTGTNNTTTKDVQCNVYDMASNIYEWTTETCNNSTPCVVRGGVFFNSNRYANFRGNNSTSNSGDNSGFRPILYIDV